MEGRLKLDEMISQRIPLKQINQAFDEMKQGEIARSVIVVSVGEIIGHNPDPFHERHLHSLEPVSRPAPRQG